MATVVYNGNSGRAFRGFKLVFGTVVLDGSNPSTIPLAQFGNSCLGGVVSIQGSVALGDDPNAVTCLASGTGLDVYGWKNTSGTDPTQVASTDNARVVDFVAFVKVT